jgi:SulP family sulfate permease
MIIAGKRIHEIFLRLIAHSARERILTNQMKFIREFLPSKRDYLSVKSSWRGDILAGITVGIVALPLALAFGITTGAGAEAGLITAIYAGFVAAIFGGSHFQVSGPTGAMTVILVPIVAKYGTTALAPLGLAAGVLVMLMGVTRCGGLINKVPWPVMEGFTLGIAIVIALQQLPTALASKSIPGANTLLTGWKTLRFAIENGLHWSSVGIVIFTLLIKFLYPSLHIRLTFRAASAIPASFVAILLSSGVVLIFHIHTPLIGALAGSFFLKHSDSLGSLTVAALITASVQIALLAAIESLLSARVADQMAHVHDPMNAYQPNRELFGQGLANVASSLVGGMPATGAIARTSVNIRSHAKSRIAAITHAGFLVIVVLLLNPVIALVPTAALAAVLIGTSYRIAKPAHLRELLQTTRLDAFTLLLTASLVVLLGLIWAILVGTAIYLLLKPLRYRNRGISIS